MKIKILLLTILISGNLLLISILNGQQIQRAAKFSNHAYIKGYAKNKRNNSAIFQGNKKKKKYFEGWYFKLVSENDSQVLSIIPGISLSENGKDQHAFIQIINGKTAKTEYYSFPISDFSFSKKRFEIWIGENYFSKEKIKLNIKTESNTIKGEVTMNNSVSLPEHKRANSGIMGWYRFVPFMQCYHGVVSLTNKLQGTFIKDGKIFDFRAGVGYIEKDWGSSMPSAWIWMQSNHFKDSGSSFMLSIAHVPWLGSSFTGFLGFYLHNNTIYRFATYTHAKLKIENSSGDSVVISIKDKRRVYKIIAIRSQTGLLKAPVKGTMDRRIPESIDAAIKISVFDKRGKLLVFDSTMLAGLEIVGNQKVLEKR